MASFPNLQKSFSELALPDKHTVHWFRKDLRLHDNPALRKGLQGATSFRCVYIMNASSYEVSIAQNKFRFLLQSLEDLDNNLRKLKLRLYVIRGQPIDVLPKLFTKWNTTCFTYEEDPEIIAETRDYLISQICKDTGIEIISEVSHTLYKAELIIQKNNGKVPTTYNEFGAIIKTMELPSLPDHSITNGIYPNMTSVVNDPSDNIYKIPTLSEFDCNISTEITPFSMIGGETEALCRLAFFRCKFNEKASCNQEMIHTLEDYDTCLSSYLRFGCVSARMLFHLFYEVYRNFEYTNAPMLYGQLLWREFFFCLSKNNPYFNKIANNPVCINIPWTSNLSALTKWANGITGFPWIDAIMRQLRQEGWIHNLCKNATACFLTRGNLFISWEFGMLTFKNLLLDAEWTYNAGMWIWLSGSYHTEPSLPYYCPVEFGRQLDPNGEYIRKYVPELKNFPIKYIHEPWTASEDMQRAANCYISIDYPFPIVNHIFYKNWNAKLLKDAYKKNIL